MMRHVIYEDSQIMEKFMDLNLFNLGLLIFPISLGDTEFSVVQGEV